MNDYKTKSCLIWDNGVFVALADKLSQSFGKVYYFTPWSGGFPATKKKYIGYGLSNVIRVNDFFDHINEADIIVFPDVGLGDLQNHLMRLGHAVWGSKKGEQLELFRSRSKEYMSSIGISVSEYETIKGIDNLKLYLQENERVWVKTDMRGDFETFYSPNYQMSQPLIDAIAHKLGGLKNVIEFVVENNVDDAVEIGSDMYCIDGQYPTASICGIEIKDKGYIAKFKNYSDMPQCVTLFNEKISDTLKKYKYRNFISTELQVTKDLTPYTMDVCARLGSPPSEIYINMFENLSDIIWNGAHGICIDPVVKEQYAIQLIIKSSWANENWVVVQIPEESRENYKFRDLCKIDDNYYIIPMENDHPEIGTVVTTGNSFEEAIDKSNELIKKIEGYGLSVCVEAIDKLSEALMKVNDYGIDLL